MGITMNRPMLRQEFLEWAEAQDERYEFDGEQPVPMNGSLLGYDRLRFRLQMMMHLRLSGRSFEVWGPNSGVATTGQRVRYPDVVVARGFAAWTERMITHPVAVFEVLSPATSRTDRLIKLREHGAVESIRYYAIVETDKHAITRYQKDLANHWVATVLTADDALCLPEIGIELPLAELYAGLVG